MSIPDKYADWKGSRVGMQPPRASASLTSRLLVGMVTACGLPFLGTLADRLISWLAGDQFFTWFSLVSGGIHTETLFDVSCDALKIVLALPEKPEPV